MPAISLVILFQGLLHNSGSTCIGTLQLQSLTVRLEAIILGFYCILFIAGILLRPSVCIMYAFLY